MEDKRQCEICKEWFEEDEVEQLLNGQYYCIPCLEDNDYFKCSCCAEWCEGEERIKEPGGQSHCEDCHEDYREYCELMKAEHDYESRKERDYEQD